MTLGELLSRAYKILSVTASEPRTYTREQLVEYLNRGILLFRQRVEDRWFRYRIPLIADQSEYDFDAQHVRTQRIAFDDVTMEPMTILGLQGMDSMWQTTPGPEPWAWSSDGLPHDQFRVYPKPTDSSADVITFVGDYGVVVRVTEDGTDATFTQETGIVVDATDSTFVSETGEIVRADAVGLGQLEVWATLEPGALVGDGDLVPIKCGYELASLWYCLWQTYSEQSDHYDSSLSSYYKGMWEDSIARALERWEMPLPNQVHVLGSSGAGTGSAWPKFQSTMTVNGNPVTVSWPRGRAFPMLGE